MSLALVIALSASALGNMIPSKRPTDLERGRELYERHCTACHGETNRGDGPAAAALVHPVPDLVGEVRLEPGLVELVLNGRGPMPAYRPSFDRADARRVIMYMAKAHDPPSDEGEKANDKKADDKKADDNKANDNKANDNKANDEGQKDEADEVRPADGQE